MKKNLFIIMLLLMMPVMVVEAKDRTLYGVLKNEAENSGLARKYTGAHQDSFLGTGDKDIYHWYAETDEEGTAVLDKNNVIFAGHCWQMFRTTDTGGVKLIYNGEAENNQCLNTRGNHIGYGSRTSQNLANNYYYGTSYNYDSTNNVFSLSGTLTQETWNMTTGSNLVGQYTCKQTTESGTCSTLYLVESYYNTSSGYVIPISNSSHFSQFGNLQFNEFSSSLAYAGYMYNTNTIYPFRKVSSSYVNLFSYKNFSTSYWFADDVEWEGNPTNKYSLKNSYQVSGTSSYEDIIGKYTFLNTDQSYSSSTVYYIVDADSSYVDYLSLSSGYDINHSYYSFTYGDDYIENGDGTYTIVNSNTKHLIDWYTDYADIEKKFVCRNTTSNTCRDLIYIVFNSSTSMYYINISNNIVYTYANNYEYKLDPEDNTYKYFLDNDRVSFWDYSDTNNRNSLNTHHYTCLNKTGVCRELSYVFYASETNFGYINLSNGKGIEDAINEMLYNDDVNAKNSIIKSGIDSWYARYLSNYDELIEDTIFCGDRSQSRRNNGGWNLDGGNVQISWQFAGTTGTSYLNCPNETDQFSTLNPKARLTYKVGLLSDSEIRLLKKPMICGHDGISYWLISPVEVRYNIVYSRVMSSTSIGTTIPYYLYGVRPVISLKSDVIHISGDGSMTNPYIAGVLSHNDIIINNNNEKGIVQIDEVNDVEEDSDVSFSIDTVLGYTVKSVDIKDENNQTIEYQFNNNLYTFEMPGSDVTISVTYEKVKSSINVEIVNETKDLNIEINDLTQVEYQEEVVFKVTPIKGYKLNNIKVLDSNNQEIDVEVVSNNNEYSFIMPAGDVTIIPSYEKVSNSVVVEDNTNTKEIVISVNDATAVVYEELVKVTIVPEDGYILERLIIVDEEGNNIEYQKTDKENEYSFIMPDTNVTITPVYKEIKKPDVNPKTGSKIIPIAIIFLTIMGSSFYVIKKEFR